MPFYCEECLEEVTIPETAESERKYYGHVFCKNCQRKLRDNYV
jgi:hypothetical protein